MADNKSEWRRIADEAATETDPERLLDVVKRLVMALKDHLAETGQERSSKGEGQGQW